MKLVRAYNTRSLRLETGLYAEDVQRYLDIFGPKQVKIVIFEEFVKNPKKTMHEILLFLDIIEDLKDFKGEAYNKFAIARGPIAQFILRDKTIRGTLERIIPPSSRRLLREKLLVKNEKKPEMTQTDRDVLKKIFNEDVTKLQKILGRELPWKNFQK